MNKAELVEVIARAAGVQKTKAENCLNATIDAIIKAVAEDEDVLLIGFGTFSQGKRAARMGRNPKTGEPLQIQAAKTVKFSVGKVFKETVNKKAKAKAKK